MTSNFGTVNMNIVPVRPFLSRPLKDLLRVLALGHLYKGQILYKRIQVRQKDGKRKKIRPQFRKAEGREAKNMKVVNWFGGGKEDGPEDEWKTR